LQAVDEIVFAATQGLELGAMLVVAANASEEGADSSEQGKMLILSPSHLAPVTEHGDGVGRPKFTIRVETLSQAATSLVMSVQDAIDLGLKLNLESSQWAIPHSHGPAMHSAGMLSTTSSGIERWTEAAKINQEMLEHSLLSKLVNYRSGHKEAEALLKFLTESPKSLPTDLKRDIKRERAAILDALKEWTSRANGWHRSVPLSLPWNGSEEAMSSYMMAKRRQTKLDLLTVAFMHLKVADLSRPRG